MAIRSSIAQAKTGRFQTKVPNESAQPLPYHHCHNCKRHGIGVYLVQYGTREVCFQCDMDETPDQKQTRIRKELGYND